MSRSLSMRDLKLIPELSHLNEIQMIHPSNDELVNKFLEQLGFDMQEAIVYLPSNHRDMNNKVAVGYRVVGEISCNRKFINSGMCDLIERISAAAYQDVSLAKEMANLMGKSLDYGSLAGEDGEEDKDFPPDQCEPDYHDITQQIRQLEEMRDYLRGSPFDSAGALKLPGSYYKL